MWLNGFKCDSKLDYLSVILQNPNSNAHVCLWLEIFRAWTCIPCDTISCSIVQACCPHFENMPSITHKWETINTSGRCRGIRTDTSKWTGPLTDGESITVSQHRITQFEYQLVVFLIVHCTDSCVVKSVVRTNQRLSKYPYMLCCDRAYHWTNTPLHWTNWRFESEWISGVALSKTCNLWANWTDVACWVNELKKLEHFVLKRTKIWFSGEWLICWVKRKLSLSISIHLSDSCLADTEPSGRMQLRICQLYSCYSVLATVVVVFFFYLSQFIVLNDFWRMKFIKKSTKK